MIGVLSSNIVRFFILVLFQVLFLKNFSLYHLAIPYFYVLFILLLPLRISNFLLFALSLLLGLSIDIFSNSIGLHATACVLMAFCRILILKVITPRDGYEATIAPSLKIMGLRWFLAYSVPLVLIHHLALFNLETFRASELLISSLKGIFSALFTLTLVLVSQYLFPTGESKKRQ